MFAFVLHNKSYLSNEIAKYSYKSLADTLFMCYSKDKTSNYICQNDNISIISKGISQYTNNLNLSEQIFKLYNQNNSEICKYLDLEFSFLLFDKNNNKIIAARDRFGVQALYYFHSNDILIISNQLKFIKEYLSLSRLDNSWVYSSLTGVVYDKTSSAIDKIRKLPPAHYLQFEDNKLEIKQYWKLEKNNLGKLSLNEYISTFKDLLIQSVENRMQNNIGSELSGGLDSSAIVGIAANYTNNLYTYSHSLPKKLKNKFRPYNDESKFYNLVIRKHKIEQKHRNITCNNIGVFNLIKNELRIQGIPINNTLPYLSNELLLNAKQDNISTIFSGFGGDEGVSNQASFMMYNWARNFNIYQLAKNKKNFIKHIIKAYYKNNKLIKYNQDYFFLNKEFISNNKFEKKHIEHIYNHHYKTLSDFIYHKLNENYISNRMELFQQTAMYRGVNYSFPLLDYKLIEFYYSIPDKYKFYKAQKRYIFKEAIKDFVPKEIYLRNSKAGATVPNVLHRFMIDYDLIYDYLQSSKNGKVTEYIDIEKMISKMALIKQLYQGKKTHANQHIFLNALMIIVYLNEDY